MRKVFVRLLVSILFLLTFALTACGDEDGIYYPSNEEMKVNLESKGYTVEDYNDINYHEFFLQFSSLIEGTLVKAVKDNDYIYFFRLINSWRCETVYDIMYENCENYNSLVKIENDKKFGNIVYCGTKNAISDAGINVVKVNVSVKV